MKNTIANIVRGKSLTYLAAVFAVLATSSAGAANERFVWKGKSAPATSSWSDVSCWYYHNGSSWRAGDPVNAPDNYEYPVYFRDGYTLSDVTKNFAGGWDHVVTFSGKQINKGHVFVDAGTTEDNPIVFTATADDYGLDLTSSSKNLVVGFETADGYLKLTRGTYKVNMLQIGPESTSSSLRGALTLDAENEDKVSLIVNGSGNVLLVHKGSVTVANGATLESKGIVRIKDGAVYVKQGGKMTLNTWCAVGWLASTTGSLEIDGGEVESKAERMTIGDVVNSTGIVVIKNGGKYSNTGTSVTGITVGQLESGTLEVDDGEVDLGERTFHVCGSGSSTASVTIKNGGIVKTKGIVYGSGTGGATITLNGGTLEATMDTNSFIPNNDTLTVTVGAGGGTIDSNNKAITIAKAIVGTGSMTYKGGGSVALTAAPTYNGTTTVEVGTTLVVPSAITGDNLAFTIPEGIADGVYEVVHISGGGVFATDVLEHASRPDDVNAYFFLNSGKTGIYCRYGVVSGDGKVWVGIAGDRKLSTAENWLGNTAPSNGDILNFSRATAAVSLDADLGEVVPATMLFGTKIITITNGTLTVNTLTNATKLAIGAGASLEVDGDIVAKAIDYRGSMTFLNSNKGTVIVHGNAVGTSTTSASVFEYADVSEANNPMQVGGIRYINAGSATYFHLDTNKAYRNDGPGDWVIGENGIGYTSGATGYYAEWYGHVKLYSSTNWTLQSSMNSGLSAELSISLHASMTFNTSDYIDPTIPRTITLKGRLRSGTDYNDSTAGFFIEGCGKVVIDTEDMSALSMDEDKKHTYFDNSQLTVRSGATLQINAGKKILGTTGRIALEAGATLALVSSGTADFAERIEPALKLPTEGAANIRIDGQRLKSGDYTILSNVTAGAAANVNLDMRGTALAGRKRASLAVEGSNLVLNIEPSAMIIVVR